MEDYDLEMDSLLEGILYEGARLETAQQEGTIAINELTSIMQDLPPEEHDWVQRRLEETNPLQDAVRRVHRVGSDDGSGFIIKEEGSARLRGSYLENALQWVQSEVGENNARVVIYTQLPEDKQMEINTVGEVTLTNDECLSLLERINDLQTGELFGEPLEEQLERELVNGWDYRDIPETQEESISVNVDQEEPIVEEEPVEEEPVVEEEPTPVRRQATRTPRRANDYTLAWELYSIGYSTKDVAYLYKSSAGSISRGLKNNGKQMRTGAETKAMRKVPATDFGHLLMNKINELLDSKYDTEEAKNTAFYQAFGVNLYEITLYEAEDEQEEIESMHERATTQGVSLRELAQQRLEEQAYVERERSPFVNKVRNLHQRVKDFAVEKFGDVNVGVGYVDVQTKVSYENGVVLTVNEANKVDEKSVGVENVVVTVNVAEFLEAEFVREVEALSQHFRQLVSRNFTKDGRPVTVSQFGNRMVVGLNNE